MQSVLDAVRTRALSVALELEKILPQAREPCAKNQDSAQISCIVTNEIYGDGNTITIDSPGAVQISAAVTAGDLDSLLAAATPLTTTLAGTRRRCRGHRRASSTHEWCICGAKGSNSDNDRAQAPAQLRAVAAIPLGPLESLPEGMLYEAPTTFALKQDGEAWLTDRMRYARA